jgi:hypothetical protein
MPTLKGCKQLVKELFLLHFLPFLPHRFVSVAAARGRHSTELFRFVNRLLKFVLQHFNRPTNTSIAFPHLAAVLQQREAGIIGSEICRSSFYFRMMKVFLNLLCAQPVISQS